jgi:hypothetical protein
LFVPSITLWAAVALAEPTVPEKVNEFVESENEVPCPRAVSAQHTNAASNSIKYLNQFVRFFKAISTLTSKTSGGTTPPVMHGECHGRKVPKRIAERLPVSGKDQIQPPTHAPKTRAQRLMCVHRRLNFCFSGLTRKVQILGITP